MSKPRHRIAVLMWLLGMAVLFVWTSATFNVMHISPVRAGHSGGLNMVLVAGAVLIAIGTIIELADRIRWKAQTPVAGRKPASAWTFLRRRPRSGAD